MKKRDLKKRIEDGFSELSPDLFEAVWEESRKQETVWAKSESEETSGNGKIYTGRFRGYALSLCASLAILCLCIFGVLGQKEKSVFMVLDINPSIQIEMNEAHQVKSLKGLNQDGKDVVKELRWKKMETVQELLDVLIQDVVEKSYLRENGGILVTLAAPDKVICENLERTLGEGIDRKLTELKVSGVTTAFQEVQSSPKRQGRKLLEAELTKSCGMDEKMVEQMSVIELIEYCQDYTSLDLKLSEASEKERAAQQKNGDTSKAPVNSSLQKESTKKDDKTEKSDEDKAKPGKDKAGETPAKENSDDTKQNSQEDNQSPEGNTNNDKSNEPISSEGFEDSTQTGSSVPSNKYIPIQPEEGEPIEPGNNLDQPIDDPAETGDVPNQPEDGTSAQKGNTQTQPGNGESSVTEDVPNQPEGAGYDEPGDTQTQPGSGSFSKPEGTFGQPEQSGQSETEKLPVKQDLYDLPKKQERDVIVGVP